MNPYLTFVVGIIVICICTALLIGAIYLFFKFIDWLFPKVDKLKKANPSAAKKAVMPISEDLEYQLTHPEPPYNAEFDAVDGHPLSTVEKAGLLKQWQEIVLLKRQLAEMKKQQEMTAMLGATMSMNHMFDMFHRHKGGPFPPF